jgi:hypothetical protein
MTASEKPEAEAEAVEKPASRLFQDVPQESYAVAFSRLQELRQQYPNYRDDELLIYLLAKGASRVEALLLDQRKMLVEQHKMLAAILVK